MINSSGFTEIMTRLQAAADPQAVAGMARFGINSQNTLGVSIPVLRQIAKESGKNHSLAGELWSSGIHEAHLLAERVERQLRAELPELDHITIHVEPPEATHG